MVIVTITKMFNKSCDVIMRDLSFL